MREFVRTPYGRFRKSCEAESAFARRNSIAWKARPPASAEEISLPGHRVCPEKSSSASHWTKKTLDGLGRVASVQTGNGGTVVSEVDTIYAPCACSPLGKMSQQSQPYPGTGTVVYTTYAYDALGRTKTVTLPDGASQTAYTYQGNATTVTDPVGKWKQYASDAFGNLVTVIEPDPKYNPGAPNRPRPIR